MNPKIRTIFLLKLILNSVGCTVIHPQHPTHNVYATECESISSFPVQVFHHRRTQIRQSASPAQLYEQLL